MTSLAQNNNVQIMLITDRKRNQQRASFLGPQYSKVIHFKVQEQLTTIHFPPEKALTSNVCRQGSVRTFKYFKQKLCQS
jgi:hypothetical protein